MSIINIGGRKEPRPVTSLLSIISYSQALHYNLLTIVVELKKSSQQVRLH